MSCGRSVARVMIALVVFTGPLSAQGYGPNHARWVLRAGNRPFLQAGYGLDQVHHRQFGGSFDELGQIQLTLGYSELLPYRTDLLALEERAVFGAYGGTAISRREADSAHVAPTLWQLGLAFKGGYGYPVGADLAILPVFGSSFDVTKITTIRPSSLSGSDSTILDRYEGSFRFGHTAMAELRFEFSRSFSLSGAYELSIVYPRVVFWQWVGSYGLAAVGMGILSQFSVEIIRSSPALGPIISWMLKSAMAYGIYSLWRDNMHWPFKSETPLMHQNATIAVTFVF
jgi:hypothetical protein